MSVEIKGQGYFKPGNIINYTVVQDATPIDPASMDGGFSTFDFSTDESRDSMLIKGKQFDLETTEYGSISGVASSVTKSADSIAVNADSLVATLNSWHALPAFAGTLRQYLTRWFEVVGLAVPIRIPSSTLANRQIVGQRYIGNQWDHMKNFLSANNIELAYFGNQIVFRALRGNTLNTTNSIAHDWDVNEGDQAHSVEVKYYNNQWLTNAVLYPNDLEEPSIIQVDASETVEVVVRLSATPNSIRQNDVQVTQRANQIGAARTGYTVVGVDDLPIVPAQWTSAGGRMEFEISDDDPTQLTVRVTGADIPRLAPFRIAESSGAGNYYNSLQIVGTGTVFDEQSIVIPTGVEVSRTGTEIGQTVENPYVSTMTQALSQGVYTAARYSGQSSEVRGELTQGSFNETVGSRLRERDAFYRVSNANFTPVSLDYTARIDTTINDFNSEWQGATMEEFNEKFEGMTTGDFSLIPLRRED